jgi:hypothetical protein
MAERTTQFVAKLIEKPKEQQEQQLSSAHRLLFSVSLSLPPVVAIVRRAAEGKGHQAMLTPMPTPVGGCV